MVGVLRLCGRPFCPIAAPAARKDRKPCYNVDLRSTLLTLDIVQASLTLYSLYRNVNLLTVNCHQELENKSFFF